MRLSAGWISLFFSLQFQLFLSKFICFFYAKISRPAISCFQYLSLPSCIKQQSFVSPVTSTVWIGYPWLYILSSIHLFGSAMRFQIVNRPRTTNWGTPNDDKTRIINQQFRGRFGGTRRNYSKIFPWLRQHSRYRSNSWWIILFIFVIDRIVIALLRITYCWNFTLSLTISFLSKLMSESSLVFRTFLITIKNQSSALCHVKSVTPLWIVLQHHFLTFRKRCKRNN